MYMQNIIILGLSLNAALSCLHCFGFISGQTKCRLTVSCFAVINNQCNSISKQVFTAVLTPVKTKPYQKLSESSDQDPGDQELQWQRKPQYELYTFSKLATVMQCSPCACGAPYALGLSLTNVGLYDSACDALIW